MGLTSWVEGFLILSSYRISILCFFFCCFDHFLYHSGTGFCSDISNPILGPFSECLMTCFLSSRISAFLSFKPSEILDIACLHLVYWPWDIGLVKVASVLSISFCFFSQVRQALHQTRKSVGNKPQWWRWCCALFGYLSLWYAQMWELRLED